METTNINKTKPNETEAWFRSPFTPSGPELDRACSAAFGARILMGPILEIGLYNTCMYETSNSNI